MHKVNTDTMDRPRNSKPSEGDPVLVSRDSYDAIVTRLANEDKKSWYRKPNLRHLYFMLVPTCMGIQTTSGFHSQMANAMQILPSWITCKAYFRNFGRYVLTRMVYKSLTILKAP
jgi:hypothetical protein